MNNNIRYVDDYSIHINMINVGKYYHKLFKHNYNKTITDSIKDVFNK